MRICIYDPLHTFEPFIEHISRKRPDGKEHDIFYIDSPVTRYEMLWQHRLSDIVWYEFCDDFFASCANHPKDEFYGTYVVNRLHSYELFGDVYRKVPWHKVDLLLASSEQVKQMLEADRKEVNFPPIKVLSNGVDLNAFHSERKEYHKSIGVCGWINLKKNLPLALYCLAQTPGYDLHFLGQVQDKRTMMYLTHLINEMGLNDRVAFHGRLPHDRVPEFFKEMDYILSPSLFESFGQSIMEGVAGGCLPLIHNFPGAKARFPSEWLFTDPTDFKRLLGEYERLNDDEKNRLAASNREFIAQNYDIDDQHNYLDWIVDEAERVAIAKYGLKGRVDGECL